jgi:Uma2 family endonuclease
VLCVEVTSGNRAYDLVTKRAKYAAAGLTDYWVADRRDQALRCHRLRDGVLVETQALLLNQHPTMVVAQYAERSVEVDLARVLGAASR